MNSIKHSPIRVFNHIPTWSEMDDLTHKVRHFFFDLDGTLCNTEVLHAQCLYKFLQDHAEIPAAMDVESLKNRYMGITEKMLFDLLVNEKVIDLSLTYENFLALRNTSAVAKLETFNGELIAPEMLTLIKDIKNSGRDMSIVSSAEKIFIEKILTKLNLHSHFQFIMSRESTSRNKPDPMPYMEALMRSGLSSHEVIVFEDSNVGLQAALGAGLDVIHAKWY